MARNNADRGLTRARSRHGPALARQPSCLVNILESRRHAARSTSSLHAAGGVPRRLRHVGPGRAA